ncbi:MAG TPA: DUF4386 family protein [Nakamurella sp.]
MARRQNETAALGFVASRVVDGSLIIVGVVSVLTTVTLRHAVADPASLATAGLTLNAIYDWTFPASD